MRYEDLYGVKYQLPLDGANDLPQKVKPLPKAWVKQANDAWGAIRRGFGRQEPLGPGTELKQNHARASHALEQIYPGMNDREFLQEVMNQMPFDGGRTQHVSLERAFPIGKYHGQDGKPIRGGFHKGRDDQHTIKLPDPNDPKTGNPWSWRRGVMFHEARHALAKDKDSEFEIDYANQNDRSKYNYMGEQPNHFPSPVGDRLAAESLEAQNVMRRYGSGGQLEYPSFIKKKMPWLEGRDPSKLIYWEGPKEAPYPTFEKK